MSLIIDPKFDVDPFGSQLVTLPLSSINYKPTWGVSTLRYSTATGPGAAVTEEGGEFKLSSGSTATSGATIETLDRGQYQAGASARFGVAARIPTSPGGTASMRWGYYDDNNGLLFGQDSSGIFVARRAGGTETRIYQNDWNGDKLNGTGSSGLTLNLANGVICQCDFTWYGFGAIVFSFVLYDSATRIFTKVVAHTLKVDGAVSIIDPNQPLRFSVDNGASNTTSYDLFIGGHQFEHFGGQQRPQRRQVSELLTNFTTALSTAWQPLIAVRPKATYGTSGRPNSVTTRVTGYTVAADSQMETRLTFGATTSNLTWGAPTGWTADETAIETKVTGGTALTTSVDGFPGSYNFVTSTKQVDASVDETLRLSLGANKEVILWVRRLSAVGAQVVLHANISVEEQH